MLRVAVLVLLVHEAVRAVLCPRCLQDSSIEATGNASFVRRHKDIPSSDVYECPGQGVFFTHPTPTAKVLGELYAKQYRAQAPMAGGVNEPRVVFQFEYIRMHVLDNFHHRLRDEAVVVEAGCAHGYLLQRLAARRQRIVCFEPTRLAKEAEANIRRGNATDVTVVQELFSASSPLVAHGIDLFVASHVLEHVGDLCAFLAALYGSMRPGGMVFLEIPNHNRQYVKHVFGGYLHLTLCTARGLLALMEAAGFMIVDMMLLGANHEHGLANGLHIRAMFAKPSAKRVSSRDGPFKGLGLKEGYTE